MGDLDYGNTSIIALKGADRVRERPEVIFGSRNLEGCIHAVFEIIGNSVDEAKEGYGNHIIISYESDNIITIQDYGRGLPMDYNEAEGRFNWELIFCELYAGGKMNTTSYSTSIGLNGLGCCAVQYSSEFMTVTSVRDGYIYTMNFEKGNPVGNLIKEKNVNNLPSGTTTRFRLDKDVFTEIDISVERINNIARRQAMILRGLLITVKYDGFRDIEWYFERGEAEFIERVTEGKRFCDVFEMKSSRSGRDSEDESEYTVGTVFAFTFSRDDKVFELYHNSSWLENGGVTYAALRKASVKVISKAIRNMHSYQKGDEKITFKDIEDVLSCIISTYCAGNIASYENQTKKAINNPFIEVAVASIVEEALEKWLIGEIKSDKVLHEIIINKQARENADRIKTTVIRKMTASIDGVGNKPKKFVDCETKNIHDRELFIVEGDSALGSCKLARNSRFQAIMPVRGKITNCMKEDIVNVFKSEIIVDLIRVLGCGVEVVVNNMRELPKFDERRLNWGKIIICTDADSDGMQIRCLIIAMIYKLIPSLLKMGKVYIAETPLYEISSGKNTYFAYNEDEKTNIINKLSGKINIQRSKGLGENEPDMMSLTTMKPGTRRLVQINYTDDYDEINFTMEALLGNDIVSRRMFIDEYSRSRNVAV